MKGTLVAALGIPPTNPVRFTLRIGRRSNAFVGMPAESSTPGRLVRFELAPAFKV